MFESNLCRGISKHNEWFGPLKFKLDRGLVFRLRKEATGTGWAPGMMKREGTKWVWKEKSFEELREYGIHLLSVSLFTSSAVLTVWRIYRRVLVDVSAINVEVIPPPGCQGLVRDREETRLGKTDLNVRLKQE